MNIFEKIDEQILLLAKQISRSVYLLVGVNNFFIGKSLLSLAFFLTVLAIFSKIHSQNSNILGFLFSYFMPLSILIWYIIAHFIEKKYKRGFANVNRINLRFFRLLNIFFIPDTSFAIWKNVILMKNAGNKDLYLDLSTMLGNIAFLLGSCLAIYFLSIEPEEPTDSLLKKLGKWFRSLLETPVLGQPA